MSDQIIVTCDKLSKKFSYPNKDSRIHFDEPAHKYTLDNGKYTFPRSVSGVYKAFFEPFNPKVIARGCIRAAQKEIEEGKKKTEFEGKYTELLYVASGDCDFSIEEVIRLTADAWSAFGRIQCSKGTSLHRSIELRLNDVKTTIQETDEDEDETTLTAATPLIEIVCKTFNLDTTSAAYIVKQYNPLSPFHPSSKRLYNDKVDMCVWQRWRDTCGADIEPIRTEWSIFSERWSVAGQVDALFRRISDGAFILIDWKRVGDIKTSAPRNGKPPLENLPDSNFGHYIVQLSIYAYILEIEYKIKISEAKLVQISPDTLPSPGFKEYPIATLLSHDIVEKCLSFGR